MHEFMTDERTTAYLLNELHQSDADRFEEQCFDQPEWPDVELDSAEEDLIQAYIRNELSPERQRRFEENYLTTDARIERVLLARSFQRLVCSGGRPKLTLTQRLLGFLKSLVFTPHFSVPRFATIVVTLGLMATLLWFAIRSKPPQTFAHINLVISTATRDVGSQPPVVKVPISEDALRISLTLPEPVSAGANYRVEWRDIKGLLENLEIEKQDAKSISVIIPADKLNPGQYVLKLFRKNPDGTEELVPGNYFFDAK